MSDAAQAPIEGPTPGLDPVVTLTLGSQQMRVRRPSRSDDREINRRYVAKLLAAAPAVGDPALIDVARRVLDQVDGGSLYSEAQLEVLLVPRDAAAAPLGEDAPAHWYRSVTGANGQVVGRVVSFDNVSPDEFARVAVELAAALAEKKSNGNSVPPSSTATAPSPNSA